MKTNKILNRDLSIKPCKIESDFIYKNLRCVVIFQPTGYRCGYVGIEKTHSLYEKDYNKDCKVILSISDLEYSSPESYFDVHGGITYSGGGINSKYPVESNLWWFGFDCAHCDDAFDYETALKYGLISYTHYLYLKQIDGIYHTNTLGILRTKEYVEYQCKELAKQLAKI